MRGLVSFTVFGSDPDDIYFRGAIKNAEMYLEWHPEWECRFHLGKQASILKRDLLRYPNVSVVERSEPEDQSATLWRFDSIRSEEYDFYISRDVDSRPYDREKSAVEEWLASSQQWHVMRDHPRHGVPMLAGLWGVKSRAATVVRHRLPGQPHRDYYQVDQDYLRSRIWKYARGSLMAHVGCRWGFGYPGITRRFPVARKQWEYVAECHNGDETLRFPTHRVEVMLDPWVVANPETERRKRVVSASVSPKVLHGRAV